MNSKRRWTGIMTVLLAATVAACGSQSEAGEAENGEASQPATQQQASDRTATPATATVAAGTSISLALDEELSTKTNQKGDSFSATVTRAVVEGNRVLIPEGAIVRGTVTAVQKEDGDRPPLLKVDFATIEVRGQSVPLAATLTSADIETEKEMKGEAKKIGGGAAAGAIAGGIIGGGVKSAAVGAAVGAAAGTVITLVTREGHGVLPAGTAMEIRVDESLNVRI